MKISSMFTEKDGKYSFSRISVSCILAFYFIFAGFTAIQTLKIPDVPIQLAGLAAILYGVNKVATSINSVKERENDMANGSN